MLFGVLQGFIGAYRQFALRFAGIYEFFAREYAGVTYLMAFAISSDLCLKVSPCCRNFGRVSAKQASLKPGKKPKQLSEASQEGTPQRK